MTSPIPKRRKGGTSFDAELREFMRETEMTARKIIKTSNRKVSPEMRDDEMRDKAAWPLLLL